MQALVRIVWWGQMPESDEEAINVDLYSRGRPGAEASGPNLQMADIGPLSARLVSNRPLPLQHFEALRLVVANHWGIVTYSPFDISNLGNSGDSLLYSTPVEQLCGEHCGALHKGYWHGTRRRRSSMTYSIYATPDVWYLSALTTRYISRAVDLLQRH
ncbi:hypothetical protein DM02DRAFT_674244 [Periconia macrospinosa]|uniref:Uncharacterized protein n=1 Tax=Periconia macrospinosa TaxID=97972 RepID=A0A2V1DGU3_9PLEO|nr:hypothetical protein DM02DRAFT_674244 [Periconia macrospinosa]